MKEVPVEVEQLKIHSNPYCGVMGNMWQITLQSMEILTQDIRRI